MKKAFGLVLCFLLFLGVHAGALEALPGSESGYREYTYEGQKVVDYLGEGEDADRLRDLLLPAISVPEVTDLYYHLYLGTPVAIDGGHAVLAGKRHDGEWMPSLYYVEDGEIQGRARQSDVWAINRARIDTGAKNTWYAFFGFPLLETDVRPESLRISLVNGAGEKSDCLLEGGNQFYLVLSREDARACDFLAEDAQSGESIDVVFEDYTNTSGWYSVLSEAAPGDREEILSMNLLTCALAQMDWRYWGDGGPYWQAIAREYADNPIENICAQFYRANFDNGETVFETGQPVPMSKLLQERRRTNLFATQNKYLMLYFHEEKLGEPTALTAVLHTKDGQKALRVRDGKLRVEKPRGDEFQVLILRADYGEQGYISWVVHLHNPNVAK